MLYGVIYTVTGTPSIKRYDDDRFVENYGPHVSPEKWTRTESDTTDDYDYLCECKEDREECPECEGKKETAEGVVCETCNGEGWINPYANLPHGKWLALLTAQEFSVFAEDIFGDCTPEPTAGSLGGPTPDCPQGGLGLMPAFALIYYDNPDLFECSAWVTPYLEKATPEQHTEEVWNRVQSAFFKWAKNGFPHPFKRLFAGYGR